MSLSCLTGANNMNLQRTQGFYNEVAYISNVKSKAPCKLGSKLFGQHIMTCTNTSILDSFSPLDSIKDLFPWSKTLLLTIYIKS